MSKKIQLSIPKPCHENWDAMTPVEKGKFCSSCAKEVVDFSTMSDRQVAEFFKKPTTGSVCGRFMVDQLERDIEIPKKRLPWFKYFFSIALPAFFFAKAGAQNNQKMGRVKPVTRDTMPSHINQEYKILGMVALPDKFIPVEKGTQKGESGRVVDANTNMPLPGAEVYLFSTIGKEKIYVQRDGSFIIDFYRKIIVDRIEISLPGYIQQTLQLDDFLKLSSSKQPIKMEREDMLIGKIAIADCVKPVMGDTIAVQREIDPTGQKKIINGIVKDNTGAPIQGASVVIKGTRTGVATDNDGHFRISVSDKDTLVLTGGIIPQLVAVGTCNFLSIEVIRMISCGEVAVSRHREVTVGEVDVIEVKNIQKKQNPPANSQFKVFPNPITTGTSINIEWKESQEGYFDFELISQSGHIVHKKEVWIDANAKLLDLEIPQVPAGSYFLVMTSKKSGKKFSEKIIVQ